MYLLRQEDQHRGVTESRGLDECVCGRGIRKGSRGSVEGGAGHDIDIHERRGASIQTRHGKREVVYGRRRVDDKVFHGSFTAAVATAAAVHGDYLRSIGQQTYDARFLRLQQQRVGSGGGGRRVEETDRHDEVTVRAVVGVRVADRYLVRSCKDNNGNNGNDNSKSN